MTARLLLLGEHAVLVELDDAREVLAVAERLRRLPGVAEGRMEVVPAARTVMVRAEDPADLALVRGTVDGLTGEAGTVAGEQLEAGRPAAAPAAAPAAGRAGRADAAGPAAEEIVVPVSYDGPDLEEVARLTGLGQDEVVLAHTGVVWTVAFIGFAPGFAYLAGGDPRLQVPRRHTPRTTVPAGAVGLAGEWSGIYPRPSPGGWQLVGRTELVLWDVDRDPPALLAPGTRVRFEAT